MKKSVIYKITNPSGKIYIGKTIDFHNRMNSYQSLNNKSQKAIHASILKYGWDNHKVDILEECEPHKLNEFEIYYIKKYNSFSKKNPNGLNLTEGGEGTIGRKDTIETKIKRAEKHIGSKRSEETKKLMSVLKKGKIPYASKLPRSEKQLYHIKYGSLGKKKSEETLKMELDTKLKNFLSKHGGVLQINKDGDVVKEWLILPKHIAKSINYDDSALLKALKNPSKTVQGFHWKYKNDIQ